MKGRYEMIKQEEVSILRKIFAIIGMGLGGLIIAMALALIFGLIVMWLWNWLMPVIFGLPAISFWQAWGLVVLSHIFFKSFPYHNTHRHDDRWKKRFISKYGNFSKKEDDSAPSAVNNAE